MGSRDIDCFMDRKAIDTNLFFFKASINYIPNAADSESALFAQERYTT
jgi:hypothetical protein